MRYAVPPNVAWVVGSEVDAYDETIYVMRVPDGLPAILTGIAAEIWLEAAGGHDVVPAIAALTGEDPALIAPDTEAFLADLVTRGLLAVRND